MNLDQVIGLYNYWIVVFLMMTGFYIVLARENLIKSVIGLNIFQTSVFLLYITMGKINGGTAPILIAGAAHGHGHGESGGPEGAAHGPTEVVTEHADGAVSGITDAAEQVGAATEIVYSNPLPSVLMLTAIVVGIATTALALALIVRIREEYGTLEENQILKMDRQS